MKLEKLIPRLTSFLPGMLYVNTKEYSKRTIEKIDKKMSLNDLNKSSKYLGAFWEGLRLVGTGVAATTPAGIEAALITYGAITYISDRAADAGFFPAN